MTDPNQIPKQLALPQYDLLRKRVQQQGLEQKDEAMEALKRRMASQGMLNSGAYNVSSQQVEDQANKQTNDALQGVSFQEAQELQRQKEVQDQRDFQKSEREASQGYATGERVASQGYATKEREATQLFSKNLYDEDMLFQKQVHADQLRYADLDNVYREKEFTENQKTNSFNKLMALWNQGVRSEWDTNIELDRMQRLFEKYKGRF